MNASPSKIQSRFLGTVSYADGLQFQDEALAELVREKTQEARTDAHSPLHAVVLGLEHFPVATLGVRGVAAQDFAVSAAELAQRGLEVRETARGGQATIHSPGQLVIYPCVNLKLLNLGARSFVELIERSTLRWLHSMGVLAEASVREPGLFVRGSKLVAFGFKISHGLTSHGLAVNVSNDIGLFSLIRTCGVEGQPMTRLKDLGLNPSFDLSLEALFLSWCEAFSFELGELQRPILTDALASH